MPPTSLCDALAAGYWSGSGMWVALFSFPHALRPTPHDRWGAPSMPRAELGIHGLKPGAATGLEKSEKRGVQTARNAPSEVRKGHPLCGTKVSLYKIPFHQNWTGVW
jgi:hypothetical protein